MEFFALIFSAWRVYELAVSRLSKKAQKQATSLPESIRSLLFQLLREIELLGPVRGNWPNCSKLLDNKHHCHFKKGKPTYMAVWEISKKEIKLVKVIYAGTHEKATY